MRRWRFLAPCGLTLLLACSKFDSEAAAPEGDAGLDAGPTASCGRSDGDLCTSCAELLRAQPAAPSSTYSIRTKQGGKLTVYCDMTTAGGGWTMAARSEVTGAGTVGNNFGWNRFFGEVTKTNAPYSLGVMSLLVNLPTEMLFGLRGDLYAWGPQVYRAKLPLTFFTDKGKAFDISGFTEAVIGACPRGAFQKYAGYVDDSAVFLFHNNGGNDSFGLQAGGWAVDGSTDCARGGGFTDGSPGMIFVR